MPDPGGEQAGFGRFTEDRRTRGSAHAAETLRNPDHVPHVAGREMDYQADEVEFMLAAEAYKARVGRRYPSWSEVLRVVKDLGYEKKATQGPPSSS